MSHKTGLLLQNMLQRRLVRNEASGAGLPLMVIKENGLKTCRWRCSELRGRCRTCLKGTQQRNEGAVEAPEGKRSVEVKRARQGSEGGERKKRRCQRIRGPLSPAWKPSQRGGRGHAAWLYSQPGDARSPSASSGPEPEQGKPAQRRTERYREGQTEEACKEAGHVQREKSHTERERRHTPTHNTREKTTRFSAELRLKRGGF